MFRQLRNRFIWMTMLATTSIVVLAFAIIFVGSVVAQNARERERRVPDFANNGAMEDTFREAMREEGERHREDLLFTLLVVGVGIEVLVLAASYLYAEKAIEPVRQAYEKQRDFIANASHELKTPIAAIRANFEALDATEEPWVSNIDTELTRANQLVLDLLALARTDDVLDVAEKQKVNLAETVRKRVKVIEPRLEEKTMMVSAPNVLEVATYKADFEQILNILLDNAAKYAKSKIEVGLKPGELVVKNDGKTIPKEKLARIFDRFYQVDKTANGTGLGLAIAKAVADKRQWNLSATSEKQTIEFRLKFR